MTLEILKYDIGYTLRGGNHVVGNFSSKAITVFILSPVSLQVLVGESIVKQKDPGAGIAGLFGKDISVKPEVQTIAD
jgi:indole-3-glycerol phosphate synthase